MFRMRAKKLLMMIVLGVRALGEGVIMKLRPRPRADFSNVDRLYEDKLCTAVLRTSLSKDNRGRLRIKLDEGVILIE